MIFTFHVKTVYRQYPGQPAARIFDKSFAIFGIGDV